jgi:hypothetical protein
MGWGGSVAMAALDDGRPQLWAESGGALWSTWYVATSWLDWCYLRAQWTPQPPPFTATCMCAGPLPDGRLQFFAVDTAGAIWSCWKSSLDPSSAWTAWTTAWRPAADPEPTAATVAVAPLSDGRLQFFTVDTGGALWSCWKQTTDPASAWNALTRDWTPQPPPFSARAANGALAVAPLSDGRLQFWAVDGGGAIWSCWKTTMASDSAWSDWTNQWTNPAPAFSAQAVAAAPLSDGRVQFWALDTAGHLQSCWKTGDSQSPWTPWTTAWTGQAPPFTPQSVAAAIASDITALWSVDGNGRLWTTNKVTSAANDAWTEWALQFEMQRQEQTNWCWSACATAASHYYDPSSAWQQCKVATTALGGDCCANPGPCNQGWYLDRALQIVGHLDHWQGGTVPQATITSETAAGRPLGVRQAWDGGGAHFIMLSGGGAEVVVHDPWYGPSYVPYATLVRGYQGSGSWTDSYFTR